MSGKLVRLFLVNGNPNGMKTLEISNMTIYGTIFPRTKLKDFLERCKSKKAGSYILLGSSIEDVNEVKAYVGEGNPVFERLKAHADGRNQKDFWDKAIVFTSKDDYITKTQIQYLESEIYRLADEAGKVKLENAQRPTKPVLSEVDNSEMEHFIDGIKLLLSSVGINILESQWITPNSNEVQEEIIYTFKVKNAEAKMKIVEDKYVVMKGSTAVIENRPSAGDSIVKMRKNLIEDKIIKKEINEEVYTFKENYIFTSPSYAAAAISGGEENGRTRWKYNGKSLNDLEAEEVERQS